MPRLCRPFILDSASYATREAPADAIRAAHVVLRWFTGASPKNVFLPPPRAAVYAAAMPAVLLPALARRYAFAPGLAPRHAALFRQRAMLLKRAGVKRYTAPLLCCRVTRLLRHELPAFRDSAVMFAASVLLFI